MPDETCWQLRFEPGKWAAGKHVIKVYVGTDGIHQDEFLRGGHPGTLFRGSIATPSLEAAIINAKYINSNPLDRLSRDFRAITFPNRPCQTGLSGLQSVIFDRCTI